MDNNIHEQSFGNNNNNNENDDNNGDGDQVLNEEPKIERNNIDYELISKKNKNYQNQILLLTQRIKVLLIMILQ